ncbi:uncharacterized protein LOC141602441 [Silene latifolia]|uniref:uncharacterized protein LOC141602441 n=1 Tax=Silene latifolia TaxID=37657 RepID=UPI003D78997D
MGQHVMKLKGTSQVTAVKSMLNVSTLREVTQGDTLAIASLVTRAIHILDAQILTNAQVRSILARIFVQTLMAVKNARHKGRTGDGFKNGTGCMISVRSNIRRFAVEFSLALRYG